MPSEYISMGPAYSADCSSVTAPPKFDGVVWTAVHPEQGRVMEQEVHSLLVKEAIERVPPLYRESGFYGRYFIVPRKDGGLRPILDLRHLNRSLRRFRFKMLTIPTIVSQIRSEDWFVTIGLKDATSMFPSFLLTGSAWGSLSGGEAFQYRVLPFGQDKARPRYHCKAVPRTAGAHGSCVQRITFWPSVHETPTVVVKNQGVFLEREPFRMIRVTRRCLRALSIWKRSWFLSQGPVLGVSCRRKVVSTDSSLTGWGTVMDGRFARGLWQAQHSSRHINCLEMLAVYKALRSFLPELSGHHVLIRADNMSVVSYLNHQGGLRSRPLCRLAHQILLWSKGKLSSLRAMYVPGDQNRGADILSRQGLRPGEWRLHPPRWWSRYARVEVDLFASRETTHCPLWFSLRHPAPLGLDAMVQTWPRLRLYAFPPIALLPGVLERVRKEGVSLLLVAPFWPAWVWFSDIMSLLAGQPWQIPLRRDLLSQAGGTIFHPRPELWKLWVWPLRGRGT